MNNKLVKTLMISFVLVFSMFFIDLDNAKAESTQGQAFCTYYLNDKNAKLYEKKTVKRKGENVVQFNKKDWEKDFQITINIWGTFEDGVAYPDTFKYTADCHMWGKNGWEKGSCLLPEADHVDKTKFSNKDTANVSTNSGNSLTQRGPLNTSGAATTLLCPKLYLNGVIKTNGKYYLDFSANSNTTPRYKKQGTLTGISPNSDQSSAVNDISIPLEQAKLDKAQGKANENKDTSSLEGIDTTGGVTSKELSCQTLDPDGKGFINELVNIFTIMQVAAIILLILLSIWDFTQAVTSSEDDRLKKASKRFVHRLIAAAILLLLPVIIKMILQILIISGVEQIGDFCIDQFL